MGGQSPVQRAGKESRLVPSTHTTTLPATQGLDVATQSLNAWIEVDLDALDANVAAIRSVIEPGTELIAVVKANAYGHGLGPVARTLERSGVERFGVAWMGEALAVRSAGVTSPVIVLEHVFPADAPAAVANSIACTIHSKALADAFAAAARVASTQATVQLKVDTGLRRFGNTAAEAIELAEYCRGIPELRVEALWTHMANADEADDGFSLEQLARFQAVREQLDWIPYCHAANSATTLRQPVLHFDGVRAGVSLYGICPPHSPNPGLQPVLSLKARLARVMQLEVGEGVSYGLTWRAPRPSIVGLVPVGYGDGWRRSLGNSGSVLVGGQRCPMVGRVCMDMFLVDLTDLGKPSIEGDEVVLLGQQGGEAITAEEVAEQTGTIPWEVLAALLPRLPRLYRRGGVVEINGQQS
jgi:alanine racemase